MQVGVSSFSTSPHDFAGMSLGYPRRWGLSGSQTWAGSAEFERGQSGCGKRSRGRSDTSKAVLRGQENPRPRRSIARIRARHFDGDPNVRSTHATLEKRAILHSAPWYPHSKVGLGHESAIPRSKESDAVTDAVVERSLPVPVEGRLTDARWREWRRNRDLAKQRFNWSDGGHWIGNGPEPNPSDTLVARCSGKLILEWPSDECVDKFRDQSAEIATRLGYGVAALAAYLTRGLSWGTGLTAGLAGSYLLSKKGGIRVHRGWSYVADTSLEVRLSAHPWGDRKLIVRRDQRLIDHEGKLQDQHAGSYERDLSELDDATAYQLLRTIGNREGSVTRIVCPDANVILNAQ